ncbi:hypothetical protein [Citrobacter amalonaticus]|nr:hypothetical protein [Citrobacter amalonaticus]MBJ9328270.1 hypothetical protein [Citrobacter amalonaticus]HCD7966642.1 hypothetical protein [Citrobacter amalonaticus]
MLKINLSGDIALGLGFGGDIEIQFGPFFNHSTGGSGVILSGVATVIIGG